MDYLTTDLPDNREQTGKLLDDILHHFIGSVHKAGQLLYKTKNFMVMMHCTSISWQVNRHVIGDNKFHRIGEQLVE